MSDDRCDVHDEPLFKVPKNRVCPACVWEDNERLRGKAAEALARASDAERERLDTLMENDRLRGLLRQTHILMREADDLSGDAWGEGFRPGGWTTHYDEVGNLLTRATSQPQAAHSYASTCQHGNLPGACVLCAVAADKSAAVQDRGPFTASEQLQNVNADKS